MNFEELEADIIDRLKPLAAGDLVIEAFPETQAGFEKAFKTTRVWIMYDGELYEPNGSGMNLTTFTTDVAAQDATTHFKAIVQSRKVRGKWGLYETIDIIRKRLLGYCPLNQQAVKLIHVRGLEIKENTWQYEMLFGFIVTQLHAAENVDETGLKSITFDENYPVS